MCHQSSRHVSHLKSAFLHGLAHARLGCEGRWLWLPYINSVARFQFNHPTLQLSNHPTIQPAEIISSHSRYFLPPLCSTYWAYIFLTLSHHSFALPKFLQLSFSANTPSLNFLRLIFDCFCVFFGQNDGQRLWLDHDRAHPEYWRPTWWAPSLWLPPQQVWFQSNQARPVLYGVYSRPRKQSRCRKLCGRYKKDETSEKITV